jgi:flagellar hook protein FlgE
MKGKSGDSFTLTIPTFQAMTDLYKLNNGGFEPQAGNSDVDLMSPALIGATPYTPGNKVIPAEPNRNLGLSSVGFNLSGGTAGGVITLDELSNITIGSDGTVSVSHAEKGTVAVGKITLANFSNPRGLMQVGSNYYKDTVNSGPPVLADPGSGGTGALKSSALEMSNVDLANEFADMIVTQRGFQANTRIVSVSDQMLEELVNLKR